jgi:hypothetical protein
MRALVVKMIEQKQAEAEAAEMSLRVVNAVLTTLQELLKSIDEEAPVRAKEHSAPVPIQRRHVPPGTAGELRAGSAVYKARTAITKAGHSLHIAEILIAIGKPNNKKNRISLSGSLGAYVRENKIFTRTGPNIFGLIGMAETLSSPFVQQDSLLDSVMQ